MVSINNEKKEINCKIVYYGPGLGGKTTNLQVIHRKVPSKNKSDMVSLATESDRTLFFDYLPLDLGNIKGFSTKFQLYTVPGQVYYNETRKLVLRGVDGIVFVADSQLDMMQENLDSLYNLEQNLIKAGYEMKNIPMVIQYNKRDMGKVLSISELESKLNSFDAPFFEAVAIKGQGVFETLKAISKAVIHKYNTDSSRGLTVRKFKKKTPSEIVEEEKSRDVIPPISTPAETPKPLPLEAENVDAEIQNYIKSRKSNPEPKAPDVIEDQELVLDSPTHEDEPQELEMETVSDLSLEPLAPEETLSESKTEDSEDSVLDLDTSGYNGAFLDNEKSGEEKGESSEEDYQQDEENQIEDIGLSQSLAQSQDKKKSENPFMDSEGDSEFDYTPDKPGYTGVSDDLDEDSSAFLDIKPYTGLSEEEKKKKDDGLDFDPYGDGSNY